MCTHELTTGRWVTQNNNWIFGGDRENPLFYCTDSDSISVGHKRLPDFTALISLPDFTGKLGIRVLYKLWPLMDPDMSTCCRVDML